MKSLWKSRDTLPPADTRILAFSPVYLENHPMRFRVIDSDSLNFLTDATHWQLLEGPSETLEECDHCDCWLDHRDTCCDCGTEE